MAECCVRRREKEESSTDAHPRNDNGAGNKTATGWAEFVFDLELADEVEVGVTMHVNRRSVMKSEHSAKNDPAGNCAHIPKGVYATEKDLASEDAQATDHLECHESINGAAPHPMNSDSEQTSRDDGWSPNKHSNKRLTSQGIAWENCLSELADYRKIYGHCNIPRKDSENAKLGKWVAHQRHQYSLHLIEITSQITLPRIEALERLGFERKPSISLRKDNEEIKPRR
jgi:hypothetical protein